MEMGKLLECKDKRIDISEIPFKKYLDRNINLKIIPNKEVHNKKYGAICMPYDRQVYSIVNIMRMALDHYINLQEEENIKKLIKNNEFKEIKCDCKQSKEEYQWFGASFYDDLGDDLEEHEETIENLQQPTLICRMCGKEWGKMPDVVLDIYSGRNGFEGIRNDNQIITPEHDGLVWVIFDDKHLDWERTGNVYIR